MMQVNTSADGMTRWTRFAGVGLMGFLVQLATLQVLTAAFGVPDVVAILVSVEAAILHNYIWHERWTWGDRQGLATLEARLGRLARFNIGTGVVSLAGNVVFTIAFVQVIGLPVLAANIVAVACLSAMNFYVADRLTFRAAPSLRPLVVLLVLIGALAIADPRAEAAELKPETARAWDRYVAQVEARLAADARRGTGLPIATLGDRVRGGEIPVDNVADGPVHVPSGTISHWRGYVFVPGATIDQLLDRVALRTPPVRRQQDDVLETRVLARDGDSLRLFLKLQRKVLVTVAYNTEHRVSYRRDDAQRASSRSVSTKIAELQDQGTASEREKPVGQDRGFMWRLHSYWRYQAMPGGVMVELESVTLSRDVPWAIRVVAGPIIDRIARESMRRALSELTFTGAGQPVRADM